MVDHGPPLICMVLEAHGECNVVVGGPNERPGFHVPDSESLPYGGG